MNMQVRSPQVDERAGLDMARQRCADWGFKSGSARAKTASAPTGPKSDCNKWQVIREYRCLKDVAR